jgi:thiosulfate/3-mercaptopyruvate sulfurtransferase
MDVMARFSLAIALVLLAAVAFAASAADENLARLVTFDELQKRLGNPELRVLDARPKADYDKGHVPGAVWVDTKAVEAMAAKPGGLVDRAAWEAWISHLGIGPKTEVVVYDAKRQLDAARLWWVLAYLGADRIGLLDCNFPLWAAQKRPVATDVPKVEALSFKVAFRAGRHATRAEVFSAVTSKSAMIVDARTDGEYAGTDKRAKRAGHVPTSCHIEWTNLVDKDGRFLDVPTLRAKFAKAGLKGGEPVITHCQSGGWASVNAFVLEQLGFKTRNYYLAWSDWGNADETPVKLEATPRQDK